MLLFGGGGACLWCLSELCCDQPSQRKAMEVALLGLGWGQHMLVLLKLRH